MIFLASPSSGRSLVAPQVVWLFIWGGVILVRMWAVKGRPLEGAGMAESSAVGLLPELWLIRMCGQIIHL